jgi:hypothetical protein
LESDGSQTAANSDVLTVQNTIIAGIRGDKFREDGTVFDAASLETWYKATARKNKLFATNDEVKISNPFNLSAPNFEPLSGSPVFNASYWVATAAKPSLTTVENKLTSYPNPFSGQATIELQLENTSFVRVFVVDIAGRVVANLQEGNLQDGKHRFVFDGSQMPKGLYFAKVIAGNDQKVVKMLSK